MYDRELMILGLRKQHSLLSDLIDRLETNPRHDVHDGGMYEARTKQIANNLRKLRKIKKEYLNHRN